MQIFIGIKNTLALSILWLLVIAIPTYADIATQPNQNNLSKFPKNLPVPNENSISTDLSMNTPEYVVIHSRDQVTLSSETSATVADVFVKEGSRFNTGDILLELDCRLQRAEWKKALAQQMAANQAYIAAKKLKGYGSISDYELIKAKSDAEIANADVDKLAVMLGQCKITAPFNGSVAELMVHAHESVKIGDPLLKIVNLENLQFEILVPSCWLKWLHVGSQFNVAINETGQTIPAKITEINPQIEPVSQSVRLIATITPPSQGLLPGMSGQAKFPEVLRKNCAQGEN